MADLRNKKQQKHLGQYILGAYYNDARLNILACLNDIREKSGKKPIENEDQIKHALSDLALSKATPERQSELIKQLRHRFRFLDVLADAGAQVSQKNKQDNATPLPQYYESHLGWMLELVNNLRNTMVHPADKETTIPYAAHKKLYLALNKIYKSSFHTLKTRFGHTTETMRPFELYKKGGILKSPAEFSFALCINPLKLDKSSNLPQSQVLHDFGHILFCSLFLEKSQSAELVSYFWQTRHGNTWVDTQQRSIIREMATVYRVHLPVQRLKSDDTTTAVTLDTLSELSRCPRTLLEVLSPDDQNRFRGESGNDSETTDENEESAGSWLFARSRQDRFIPLMMRFFDFNPQNKIRFAVDLGQFYYNVRLKPADRFTDEKARVRRLGQKILAYGKLADFETDEKPADWLQLEANYSESRDAEEQILQNAGATIQTLKAYIVPTYPHYHYFDDKIGFRLNNTASGYPDLQAQRAQEAVGLDSPAGRDMMPEFWMSPAQMLELVFYSHLQATNSRYLAPDILLTKYRAGTKNLLNALAQGNVTLSGAAHSAERREQAQRWVDSHFDHQQGKRFAVPLSCLPKVVIQHLLGADSRQTSTTEVIARAEHILGETTRKQEQLKQLLQHADKKRGQKGFKAIKCGHIGDFLTDDLMRFQPVDASKSDGGKINSQQYQILQAALAYYGAHLNEPPKVVDLLRDAGLLRGKFAHPFIGDLKLEERPDQFKGLISFYEAYLQARARYLKQFIKEHQKRRTIDFLPHWLRLRQPSSLGNWLGEQLDGSGNLCQPVPLLNGLLYPPILLMVAETLGISPETLEQEGTQRFEREDGLVEIRPSVTWLIKRYLAAQGDGSQTMYHYPRRHALFDTWLDTRTQKQRFKEKPAHYLTETESQQHVQNIRQFLQTDTSQKQETVEKREKLAKLLKAYKHDWQRIRHSVSQDMLLYLYARQYFHKLQLGNNTSTAPLWSLQGLENTLLNTEIRYVLTVPKTDKALFHPACKIRNLGELGLLVRDRRLPSLLAYYPPAETELHHAEIRAELNSYRRAKVRIMALVHELERSILAVLRDVPKRDNAQETATKAHFGKGRHGDFLYALHEHHQQTGIGLATDFNPVYFKRTLLIRNAFSHNQYPEVAQFVEVAAQVQRDAVPDNPALHRKVAERLLSVMQTLYDPWLDYLRQQRAR